MKAPASGPLAWMARNTVAANLLMFGLLIGGALVGSQVKQEVFPEFELDLIQIGVPYPGASPAEVEQGIVLAIEEGVRGIDGVKQVTSSAAEGAGGVTLELIVGVDANNVLQDVKNAVDRITSFPENAERPTVSLLSNRQQVVSIAVHGQESESNLRQVAEDIRAGLLRDPEITYVELSGIRPREISIEVSEDKLRAHGVTLSQIARTIKEGAVELPGGGIKTKGGELLLRVAERRDVASEFADMIILSSADGGSVRLGDIADKINDGFADTDQASSFDGEPAVLVNTYRAGVQTPIDVSEAVKKYMKAHASELPPGVTLDVLSDSSEVYRERIDLLVRNAQLGLILVLLTLGMFLEVRLAFWVTMGIPISFLGSMLLMPAMGVSINMISLFAFIITLGIVVDDAIVVGENIYEARQRGMKKMEAAIHGVQTIFVPVTFSILTTVVAFLPLFFVPGFSGKIFRVIPSIVVSVLVISLVESLLVLPAHLGHEKGIFARIWGRYSKLFGEEKEGDFSVIDQLNRPQRFFSKKLASFIKNQYGPVLRSALINRYFTVAIGMAIFIMTIGFVGSGRLDFTFMPKVDSDTITARAVLPYGVPAQATEDVDARLLAAANEIIEENGGRSIVKGIYALRGSNFSTRMHGATSGGGGGHLGNVVVFLVPSDQREIGAREFARLWRERTNDLVGLESLSFRFSMGPGGGPGVEIELSHRDLDVLEKASAQLAKHLGTFSGVKDIDDGFSGGKPQLDFKVTPEGRNLGLTASDIGRQVRSAYFGAEALRQQRGRDEVRVMVRLPERDRRVERSLEQMILRAPDGSEVPLAVAATIDRGRSYTTIKRTDGRRVVRVSADIVRGEGNAEKVLGSLKSEGTMADLAAEYPGLGYSFEGDSRRRVESLDSLKTGYFFVMFLIYALLAIVFRSYLQPLVVMFAIPFGFVGAVIGHVLLGFDLSIISIMGLVAVSGIVVNDSLVLVHSANTFRRNGMTIGEAIEAAGHRRFRPIILTSLTTFFGLVPMILESSFQARFLIPMAISLAFGVLFATFVILLIVPSIFVIVEDLRALVLGREEERPPKAAAEPQSL